LGVEESFTAMTEAVWREAIQRGLNNKGRKKESPA
jgi:hypothetical protein